jgi:hypothetical protein
LVRYQGFTRLNNSGQPAPLATVTVYLSGTNTLATIYLVNIQTSGHQQTNPFTAGTDGSFLFYAPDGRYDVTFSAAALPTLPTIVTPWTSGDIELYDGLAAVGVYYNVKASIYGAKGDGVTDDTTAIQAAITAAAAAGGGVVWFPAGTYIISTALTVSTNGVSLVGVNRGASIISVNSASVHGITVSAQYLNIMDLAVTSATMSRTADGIHLTSTSFQVVIERVNTSGHYNGIYNGGSANIFRQSVSGPNANHGFFFDGASAAQNEIDVDFCQSNGNTGDGFHFLGPGLGVHFNYPIAAGNTLTGISITGAGQGDIYVVAPEISLNNAGLIANGTFNLTLTGGLYESSLTGANIELLSCTGVSINGGLSQTGQHIVNGFGLVINNCNLVTVSGLICYNNVPGGIQFVGTNVSVTLNGVTATSDGSPNITITSNSIANPTVVLTATPHMLVNGQGVNIEANITSVPSINGFNIATVIDATHFSIPVHVTTAGSGGVVISAPKYGIEWNTAATGAAAVVGGAYGGAVSATVGSIPAGTRFSAALGLTDQ